MATFALTSTATVVTSTLARPVVIWSLVSTALVVTNVAGAPYKLNVLGEIGPIPYFGPLS